MKKSSLISIIVLSLVCLGLLYWIWRLRHKTEQPAAYYYETAEWSNQAEGLKYARDDEDMDTLCYLPDRHLVCWFKSRRLARVNGDGTFTLTWPNGGSVRGTIREGERELDLIGVAGTTEEGITERLVLNH